jgi:hypothetical protein
MSLDIEARLAGITSLSLSGRGPKRAWLFDPHRLALPCWALAVGSGPPATLLTLDRHFDLVAPTRKPAPGLDVLALDAWARRELDVRNVDHILAAAECGLVGDVVAVARANPTGVWAHDAYADAQGHTHRLMRMRTLDALVDDYGTASASPEARMAAKAFAAGPVILDLDLDCFTSPSDADPFTLLPWPREVMRSFLRLDAELFWRDVFANCIGLTIALEPKHIGGVVAGHRLFADLAQVLFSELLRTDLP